MGNTVNKSKSTDYQVVQADFEATKGANKGKNIPMIAIGKRGADTDNFGNPTTEVLGKFSMNKARAIVEIASSPELVELLNEFADSGKVPTE